MSHLNPEKCAGAGELIHHQWLDGIVVEGKIDVIRCVEEEEARHRLPPSSVPTVVDVDALKPVNDDSPMTDEEWLPSWCGDCKLECQP